MSKEHINNNTIEITQANLEDCLKLNLIAFHWAAGGACGEGGAVVFITKDGQVYHSNYVYPGFITREDLFKIFPPLSEFRPGIMGGGLYPPMWKDKYLGLGNYLVIHESIWEAFNKTAKDELESRNKRGEKVILYNIWADVVLKVIQESHFEVL